MRKGIITTITVCLLLVTSINAEITVNWLDPPNPSDLPPVGNLVSPLGYANCFGYDWSEDGLDLALVIDASDSMNTIIDGVSKLQKTKEACVALVENLMFEATHQDSLFSFPVSVAVVAFNVSANTYQELSPLSTDKQDIINAINGLTAANLTNIGSGITAGALAINAGHTAGRDKMQILISEGRNWLGAPPANAASIAKNTYGVLTHAVQLPDPNPDLVTMQQIASNGGGVYTNVQDMGDLVGLLDGSGGNIVGMDHLDLTLPDGTFLPNHPFKNGLGFFEYVDWPLMAGENWFYADGYCTDGNMATDDLLITPEPLTLAMLGLGGLMIRRRK